MNEHDAITDEEVTTMLEDMGMKRREEDRNPFWRRWKCRLLGPHEWVPVYWLNPHSSALIEDGVACTICHKEAA